MNICSRILFGWMKFREEISEPFPPKYIIALAPHTSNWDFIIGLLYLKSKGMKCDFLMKKEWFFWPMGLMMRKLGGIPVYRDKKHGLTDIVAQQATYLEEFHLCITPEGTRKPREEWKKGFYYIALKAQIPILLFGLDYKRKLIKCTKTLMPTGDIENDMEEIKGYFKEFEGLHPERFRY